MNVDGTCGECGAYCGGGCATPTVRDEEIAAELAGELYDFLVEEGYHGHYPSAEEQADKFVAKAMFTLAPLIAEREAKAWDDCAREAHDLGWTHDYGRNDLMGRNPYRSNQ